jgi:hypothetical protein
MSSDFQADFSRGQTVIRAEIPASLTFGMIVCMGTTYTRNLPSSALNFLLQIRPTARVCPIRHLQSGPSIIYKAGLELAENAERH